MEPLTELLVVFQRRIDEARDALSRCRRQTEGDGDESPCRQWESVVQEREAAHDMLRQTVEHLARTKEL